MEPPPPATVTKAKEEPDNDNDNDNDNATTVHVVQNVMSTLKRDSIKVVGRSRWNEADASLSFDWSGTQILFRVHGSVAKVEMSATIGQDVLAVYADRSLQCRIGPKAGIRQTIPLLRDVQQPCTIKIVKLTEPNKRMPVTIHDILLWVTTPSAAMMMQQEEDGVEEQPCIRPPCDVEGGDPPGTVESESTIEFVGDSDTSGLYNIVSSALASDTSATYSGVSPANSDFEQGWPFFLSQSLGVHCPVVIAVSGAGVLGSPYRKKSLTEYYPRALCCRKNSFFDIPNNNNSYDDILLNNNNNNNMCLDDSGPLCVLVFVSGTDFLAMPHGSQEEQLASMDAFVTAHQSLLRVIREHRPHSPIVSLHGDVASCSSCKSLAEQRYVASHLQKAVVASVAGLGGADRGFFSCMVEPDIRPQCFDDWSHKRQWSPAAHRKFASAAERALRNLALCHEGLPVMAKLALKLKGEAAGQGTSTVDAFALHAAAISGDYGMVAALLDSPHFAGGEVTASSQEFRAQIARLSSLDGGVYDPAKGLEDATALHMASIQGHAGVVQLLLDRASTAAINRSCRANSIQGATALTFAILRTNAELVRIILSHGRFTAAATNKMLEIGAGERRNSLHLACALGFVGASQSLLNDTKFTSPDAAHSLTALHIATCNGHHACARLLLQHRRFTAFEQLDPEGCSALHLAARRGDTVISTLLLEDENYMAAVPIDSAFVRNAPIITRRCTALHMAAAAGHADVARILLRATRFPPAAANALAEAAHIHDPACVSQYSALHLAAISGHASVARCLLQSPAFSQESVNAVTDREDIDRRVYHGETALHMACHARSEEVVELLMDLDSRFTVAAGAGMELALHWMVNFGMANSAQLCLDRYERDDQRAALPPGRLLQAVWAGHEAVVQTLADHAAVENIAELMYFHPDTGNAIHAACRLGHLGIVQCILSLEGCAPAVNATLTQNAISLTALDLAVRGRHEDIALCLLRSEPFTAVNACDFAQQTALHMACRGRLQETAVAIIQHRKFTQQQLVTSYGKTALMLAEELELPLVLEALAAF